MTNREAKPQQAEQILAWPQPVSVGLTTTVSRRLGLGAAEDDFCVEWQQPGAQQQQHVERVTTG